MSNVSLKSVQKKHWDANLKCISEYLNKYNDILREQSSVCDMLFPPPVFEHIVKHNRSDIPYEQILIIKKGFSIDLHVLIAESEILKYLMEN